jgi:hypothetical protein
MSCLQTAHERCERHAVDSAVSGRFQVGAQRTPGDGCKVKRHGEPGAGEGSSEVGGHDFSHGGIRDGIEARRHGPVES